MAENEDGSEKTEDPTGKRLSDARGKGQVPMTRELSIWATLAMTLVVLSSLAPTLAGQLQDGLTTFLAQAALKPMDAGSVGRILGELAWLIVKVIGIPTALLAAAGIAATLLQTGGLVSTQALIPKFEKLNPMGGFKRMFSVNSLIEFGKSLAKMAVVGAVIYMALAPMMTQLEHFAGLGMAMVLKESHLLIVDMLNGVVLVLTFIMAADFVYQRWKFFQDLKMTKQEVKEEYKQIEGDPTVKGRIRSLRMQRARQRMMANVPKADVVVTNPTHFAVALKYDPGSMQAPILLAKGADLLAFRIREIAKEHDVPIVENPPLARGIYASVEVEQEIPPEHYKAMAEVISYVFRLKRRELPGS
ncbi:flagellar biosynthesis protein FlhB [Arenibaculum pallidiluteum]|uniref:flagellar biosynthesis protein FlhB n=1 Tax=Arenibaculum pallidiluteum TaxID=2812559 RepID=UPI001A96BE18|nr:flagellar biosynthesis protein FlhB [Arenibaculum pallidiluteum]